MFKRSVTYTDFNGNLTTEEFYFNLSITELIELDMNTKEGLQEWLKKIVESNDRSLMFQEFKKIVLSSYGEKSDDGKRFEKSETIRQDFAQTAAFDALLFELCTNDKVASDFVLGALPRELATQVGNLDQDKPRGRPSLPRPPMPPKAV